MATNNFKAFGIGAGANVTSQTDYEALAALLTGFQSGKASSAQINKAIRQSTVMANVLAQFISDSASVDVLDNGVPATILSNLKLGMTNLTPGRLLGPPKTITSSGIYTPSPGAKSILVECIGGGGGGGGLLAPGTGGHSVTGGGGGGGYALSSITSLAASYSVTIGASGSGGTAGNAGGNGGITSFGTLCVAAGGGGGNANITTDPTTTAIVSIAGIPGVGTTGNVLISGGERGEAGIGTANGNLGGSGGSSRAGRGGVRVGASSGSASNGSAGLGFGSGGSGAAAAATTTGAVGGAGTSGVIIVWEYS